MGDLETENTEQIIQVLLLGTTGMLVLAISIVGFVVFYQKKILRHKLLMQELNANHQIKLLQAAMEAQEKVKGEIASSLHDELGAMLAAIKLNLGMVLKTASPSEEQKETIEEARDSLDETITSVRNISKDLVPSTLIKSGLFVAVEDFAARLSKTSAVNIQVSAMENAPELTTATALSVFRVIQELIGNALKHAKADWIKVEFSLHEGCLNFNVQDNGIGFQVKEVEARSSKDRGLGLYNIESRVSLLKGEVKFNNAQIKGTKVEVSLPILPLEENA